MYLVVSGGPYGLEEAIGAAGPVVALVLCLVLPFVLSLPVALMAAELTALIPLEGGFYFWVKEAFGPFAGFVEAYLTILYTAVDMTIYPVLFAAYLSFLVPMASWARLVLELAVIWVAGLLNLGGVRLAGRAALILAGLAVGPFLGLLLTAAWRANLLPRFFVSTSTLTSQSRLAALAAALTVITWNFCGWENLSVAAGELENPRRNYLRAVLIVIPLVSLSYLLAIALSMAQPDAHLTWTLGSFVELGRQVGGRLGGVAIALGGAVSALAVFEASLLWSSRLPFVLAAEGYLPAPLAALWRFTQTPGRAIVLSCIAFSLLLPLGFLNLVALDVMFYMAALALEMAALVRLRRLRPLRDGLFTIGGGKAALYFTVGAPLVVWLVSLALELGGQSSRLNVMVAGALVAAAVPIYWFCKHRYGGPAKVEN